ncbi:SDR family oxidoreductase [Rugosimonospora acidiphila]|uniref:SDR family oxidoreductase n=1 Tax=Rugosimonospora acidiphila TaxID=556531 RepID=A0ABP9RV90_9ACTN
MNIVITGGSGFLGARLARTILAKGSLARDGAPPTPVDRLTLLDRVAPPPDLAADPRVRTVRGELVDSLDALAGAHLVFHLAAAVSAECEADFDLGIEANLRAGYALFEACRSLPERVTLVFASSLAVYGQWPGRPLPEVVTDATLPTPRTSYGTQKFILEQLLTDYTRKGFIDGRPVRLMTVSVRPGRPNGAASGFLSGIIREPLAGQRAVCPVPAPTAVALSSPARTIEGLLRVAAVSMEDFGAPVAMNLPAVRTTVADMVAALAEVAGKRAADLIDWAPDPDIEAIVTSWPARFDTARAHRLGLAADPDFASIVRAFVEDR